MPDRRPTPASTPAGSGQSASHHPAVGISVPWKKPGISAVMDRTVYVIGVRPSLSASALYDARSVWPARRVVRSQSRGAWSCPSMAAIKLEAAERDLPGQCVFNPDEQHL